MNNNWNWLLHGNSIIQELDPASTDAAPTLGSYISLIRKEIRGTLSDSEYMTKFGLVDRTTEGSAATIPVAATKDEENCLIKGIEQFSFVDPVSKTHSSLAVPLSCISYSLANHINTKFSFTTLYELYNKLEIFLSEYYIELDVGDTLNTNSGYLKGPPVVGNLSNTFINKYEITYLGTYSETLMIGMPEKIIGYDKIYVSILDFDDIELIWHESEKKYFADLDGINSSLSAEIGNTILVKISLK